MSLFDRWFGPPSEAKFAKILVSALQRSGDPRQYNYHPSDNRLTICESGETLGYVNLGNLHSTYCRLSKHDRQSFLQKTCSGFVNRMELPADFEDVKPDLRPTLRSRAMVEFTNLQSELDLSSPLAVPTVHVSDYLVACLVYDLPHTMRFLTQENLDRWGVTPYEAMEVAMQNLAEKPFEIHSVNDQFYLIDTGDAYDGTRMLLNEAIGSLHVEGRHIALPITRDLLLITGSDDDRGLQMMAELASNTDLIRPLCGVPHVLKLDQWEPWLLSPGDAHYQAFHRLHLQHLAGEYAEQQPLLQQWAGQADRDIFMATFSVMGKDEQLQSYCAWTRGVTTWLPRTDLIGLLDPAKTTTVFVPWDRVTTVCGELLSPLPQWPPRWQVDAFPTVEQLNHLQQNGM